MLAVVILSEVGWHRSKASAKCSGIKVCVLDSAQNHFLSAADIVRIIDKDFGGYTNRDIARIDLCKLEGVLDSHGYITHNQAYFTPDGMLHVDIRQMTPVLRIRNGSETWYLDAKGRCVKIREDWCTDLVCMEGPARLDDRDWLARVAALAQMSRKGKLQGMVKGFRCDGKGQVSMTLLGDATSYEFGYPVELKSKFRRLDIYMKSIYPGLQDRKYKKVYLNYTGQIVCK